MKFKNYFLLTAGDKKYLQDHAKNIDVATINANIAIHNKKAISSHIYNFNLKCSIDPMTYILQSPFSALVSQNKKSQEIRMKSSIAKLFEEMYGISEDDITDLDIYDDITLDFLQKSGPLNITELVNNVISFQKNYFEESSDFGVFEEQSKFEHLSYPYFDTTDNLYLEYNNKILELAKGGLFRLVISKKTNLELIPELIKSINKSKISAIEIWVEGDLKTQFSKLMDTFVLIKNKELIFKFVSFREIYLINNSNLKSHTTGFITAFGYGESRNIYPVGGGLPVNKIYSLIQRTRVHSSEYFVEISKHNIDLDNDNDKTKYFDLICPCHTCKELINNYGLSSLKIYADYDEYKTTLKNGMTSWRVKASQDAIVLTTLHYVENKLLEYDDFKNNNINDNKWYSSFIENFTNS